MLNARRLSEIALVVLIALPASLASGTLLALTMNLTTGLVNFWPGMLTLSVWAAPGVIPAGLIWYATRRHQPFRYLEGVLYGALGFAVGVAIFLLLASILSGEGVFVSLGWINVIWYGLVLSLPVILVIAPATVYVWHRAIRALNDPKQLRLE